MKAIKLITTLFSLLFLLLLSGCMPDSMTKWEESPPVKADAPVIILDPPKNYDYSVSLGGTETIALDINTAMPILVPNDTFVGESVTFTVSPALPDGITLNSATGRIDGTPTILAEAKEYVFTATNSGGTDNASFTLSVVQPQYLTSLTYVNEDGLTVQDRINYLQVDDEFRFTPVISTSSVTWDIDTKVDPADPLVDSTDPVESVDYPSTCYGKIKVIRGVCLDQSTGVLLGAPRDAVTVPMEVKITATKANPLSSASSTIKLSFLHAPTGLTYSQSSLLELSLNSNSGLAAGQYIKLLDNKGTASTADDTCTFTQIDSLIGTKEVLVKKYNVLDRVTTAMKITAYSINEPLATCTALNNTDMLAPTTTSLTLYQVSNVFEAGKQFTLTPTLTEGDRIGYEITPDIPETIINASFEEDGGEFTGALADDYERTSFTITAVNNVGRTSTTVHIHPIRLPPQELTYSSQVMLLVRDASAFNIGDWITTPVDDKNNPLGGKGRVVDTYYDDTTMTSAIIVDIEEGGFIAESSIDNNNPYNAEETAIEGYAVLEVEDPTVFAVGDYISNENIAFGKVRSISGSYVSVYIIAGVFTPGDNLDNAYPYAATATSLLDIADEKMIRGFTAALTVIPTPSVATAAGITVPPIEDRLSGEGIVTLSNRLPVAKLDVLDISNYNVGDQVTQGAVSGKIYAIVEGLGTAGDIYVNQISGGDFAAAALSSGSSAATVEYGYRIYYQNFTGNIKQGDTLTPVDGTVGPVDLIQARNYQAELTEPNPTIVKVRAGASYATVDPAAVPITGSNVGRIINRTVLSGLTTKTHFAAQNGQLTKGVQFDTKNPIDSSLARQAAYATINELYITNTILLRRDVEVKIHRGINRQVNANYTVYPALPAGLTLDPNTGSITGKPTQASPLKSYTVTASNERGSSTFTFNIKVEEYFEVQLDNPEASYILHRIGKKSGPRSCRVYKEQLTSGEPEEIDMTCYLEAGELDLYLLGIKFNAVAGPGMCNHMSVTPFSYYTAPYRGNSDPASIRYYQTAIENCTPVQDTDGDGHIDYLVMPADATSPGCDFPPLAVDGPEDRDDGDGDGDCAEENTIANITTDFPSVINPAVEIMRPAWIDKDDMLCISNHTDKIKCDEGKVSIKTVSFAPAADGLVYCGVPTSETVQVDCNGKRSQCVGGSIKEFIDDESIDKGVVGRIVAANINSTSVLPFATISPNEKLLGGNLYLANFSTDHSFFEISADREIDYSFNINSYSNFFRSGVLGYGDPMSGAGVNPEYTFNCLDAGNNPKARIHVMVRDWDTAFDINSPIDRNNQRQELTQTIAGQGGADNNVLTLSGAFNVTGTQIVAGSTIELNTTNNGRQYYTVASIDAGAGTITLDGEPLFSDYDVTGDQIIRHTPITGFDELGRLIETMDAGYMVDPVFITSINRQGDYDDYVQAPYQSSSPATKGYLAKREFITTDIVFNQLNGANVDIVTFNDEDEASTVAGPWLATATSGSNIITGIGPIGIPVYPQLHYLRKINGAGEDIYYALKGAKAADTSLTVYPLSRPYSYDKME